MRKIHDLAKGFVVTRQQEQLRDILATMEVPSLRTEIASRHNLLWLQRNLPINNSEHPELGTAMFLIKQMIGNQHD